MPWRKKSRRRIARPQLGTMPNLALNSGYQNRKLRTAKWGSEMGFNGLFAAQQFKGTHVADGSSTDLTAPKFNFRSSPESGLKSDIGSCPVRVPQADSCTAAKDTLIQSPRRRGA